MTIGIIGAGAAGLMAAATILEYAPTARVLLFEKNNGVGKKVIISGGGRCNVTTGIQDVRTVLGKYPRGGKFLSSAMYQFPPTEVYAWFEAHGVPLKTEEDMRVFPISNNGRDIVDVFTRLFAQHQVELYLNTHVTHIEKIAETFVIHTKQHHEPIRCDKLILTTGGQAYRHTGSTGDGYAFAQHFGHTLTPLAPSLNAFNLKESWPKTLSGLSFERATIKTHNAEFTGPFLFTHQGISGPAVFALSSLVAFIVYDAAHPLSISIDLEPTISAETLDKRLRTLIHTHPKKNFATVLGFMLPRTLADIACREVGVAIDKHAAEVSRKETEQLSNWLKQIPLTVIGRGAGDEFVTAGGVNTAEVNPSTMESLVCPNLFFAGEILNIDGFTGGFNLQASWATGRLAGQNT